MNESLRFIQIASNCILFENIEVLGLFTRDSYEGAQSNVNGDEVRVSNLHAKMLRNT